jgi:uncharacterized protein YdaU (DUF1376 family)
MSLAYFPLYPDDFEADTAHLTLAEDGAYNRLLRLCWRSPGCNIPADRGWVYRRLRALSDDDKAVIDTILDEFFTVADGRLSNARLTKEWLAANEAHERRKNAGKKGGKAKSLKTIETMSSNAIAKPKQPEPEPEPIITPKSPSDREKVFEALVAVASPEAVQSFIAYRNRMKKKLTPIAASRQAKQLSIIVQAGHDADDALGMAEERGWQSVQADWYLNAKPAVGTKANPAARVPVEEIRHEVWRGATRSFVNAGRWPLADRSPPPDHPDTLVPPDILREFNITQAA